MAKWCWNFFVIQMALSSLQTRCPRKCLLSLPQNFPQCRDCWTCQEFGNPLPMYETEQLALSTALLGCLWVTSCISSITVPRDSYFPFPFQHPRFGFHFLFLGLYNSEGFLIIQNSPLLSLPSLNWFARSIFQKYGFTFIQSIDLSIRSINIYWVSTVCQVLCFLP